MPRKIEKNAKSKEEALRLAAEEFGVSIEELSYTVEREIGKGILGRLLGREVIISAWITKEAQEEEQLRNAREQRRQVRERKAAESAKKTDASKQNNKNTEIEKPLIKKEQLIAVLDIDSTAFDRFSKEDEEGLIKICKDLVTLL